MLKLHLIELFTKDGVVSGRGKQSLPMRQCEDRELKAAIGQMLVHNELKQEWKESLDQVAERVRKALAASESPGPVLDCLRGKMLKKYQEEDRRKVEGVVVFVVKNGGRKPLYLYGPWLWFGECARLARKRR